MSHLIKNATVIFLSKSYSALNTEYETNQEKRQRTFKKKEVEAEEKKREIEGVIEKIERLILQHTKGFNQYLNYIMQNLKNNNPNEAIKCLRVSLKIEAKIKDLFEQMKELGDNLKSRY